MTDQIITAEGKDAIDGGPNEIHAAINPDGVHIMMGDQGIVLSREAFQTFALMVMAENAGRVESRATTCGVQMKPFYFSFDHEDQLMRQTMPSSRTPREEEPLQFR